MNKTAVINEVLIRRASKVIIKDFSRMSKSNLKQMVTKPYVLSVVKNLEEFGYTLNEKAIERLQTYDVESLTDWYDNIVNILFKLTGYSKRQFKPMYPNFPKQVMEMSIADLYFNALMHYFGDYIGIRIIPETKEENRLPLIDKVKYTVLGIGSEKDYIDIISKLLKSGTSWSDQDKNDIKNYLLWYDLPKEYTEYKENVAFLNKTLFEVGNFDELKKNIKTPTDLLRFVVCLCDGDISLASNTKFKLNRKARKIVVEFLDSLKGSVTEITSEIAKYKKQWQKLMHCLHIGEYRKKFPKAYQIADNIRNNITHTFDSYVEAHLVRNEVPQALKILSKRPGELARKLDHLLRIADDTNRKLVVNTFAKISDKISTNVLFQVMKHFEYRNDEQEYRIIIPKGEVSKIYALKNELPELPMLTCQCIYKICGDALMNRFGDLGFLGGCYVDPILKNYNIPFAMRSSSSSLKQLVRGTKLPMAEGSTIRMFLWWHDIIKPNPSRVDIDLSAIALDEDMKYVEHISYTRLKGTFGCHSGDITSAPDPGASEFIDINIDKALEKGYRYIAMNVLSYTGQPFKTIPEVTAGWMMRNSVQSGEIYEPKTKTVEQRYSLTSETRINIPVIFDLKERQIYWADLGLSKNPSKVINVESNMSGIEMMVKSVINIKKPNLYDLFTLHVKARGKLVDKEDADVIYDASFAENYEEIVGEYL